MSQKYYKLANACSLIYMMLHRLDDIHLLYNYSLDFLLDIFTTVLKSHRLANVKDHDTRLLLILQELFSVFVIVIIILISVFRPHMLGCPKGCCTMIKFCWLCCFIASSHVVRANKMFTRKNSANSKKSHLNNYFLPHMHSLQRHSAKNLCNKTKSPIFEKSFRMRSFITISLFLFAE